MKLLPQEWLDACYNWIESEIHPNPARDLDQILSHLERQLLESDLSASMLPGTGLPPNVSELDNTTLRGPPILVEVIAMTEIGSSAFNLQNIRQARIEHADLAGLAEEEEQNDDEGARVPRYPRSMLRFQLSDGVTVLNAIEYRRLPDLELGETPLGFKVFPTGLVCLVLMLMRHRLPRFLAQMLLKNPFVRRGIAFLEPNTVVLKYHQTEERQALADTDFMRGLQIRMGYVVAHTDLC